MEEIMSSYSKLYALCKEIECEYWSSTEDDKFDAWSVYMLKGNTGINRKHIGMFYVRAVSAF